jgi:hypothetical protein
VKSSENLGATALEMASAANRFGDFQTSKNNSESYPLNLLQTELFHHELKAYSERLTADESALFHQRSRSIFRLHCSDPSRGFSVSADVDQLLQDLVREDVKDPTCQYM